MCIRDSFASSAAGFVENRRVLADDSHIIEVWFNAVIRTPPYRDFEFMGKFYILITFKKSFMDFFGHVKRINSAVLAGRSFAAYHRANLRSGAAGCQTGFGDIAAKVLDFIIRNLSLIHICSWN